MAPAIATYTPRDPSQHGALHRDRGAPGDLSRLARMTTPRPQAYPPMWNVNFTTICGVASWRTGFCAWAVTPAQELLVPFSCKRRGFCPSCAGRRMAQTAAHLVEQIIPWVPTRQWVVSVPVPLRYWMRGPRTSRPRSIPSFAPPSVSITSTRRSHAVSSGPPSTRARSRLSHVLAVRSM